MSFPFKEATINCLRLIDQSNLSSRAEAAAHRSRQQSQPTHYTSYRTTNGGGGCAAPDAAAAGGLPAVSATSAEGGHRGSLEGLGYRSVDLKGAFE